jgi:recombination protein RecA
VNKKAAAAGMKKFEERFTRAFGEESLKLSSEINPYEVISTGSLTLDYRLSVGGYVEGRLTEIWGIDGVGKTTLSLMAIAEAQRKHPEKRAAFIDMEQKFDRAWAAAHGVDLERLWLYSPQSAEDVADALKMLCTEEANTSMVVLDSIGAMIPEVEKEKDADQAVMGNTAKIITRMVKMAAVAAARSGVVVILINQVRANLGYGADTTTGGGWSLKHATTMKFKLRRTGTVPFKTKIGNEERVVGHELAIEVQRNGVAPAYRTAIVTMFHVTTDKYGPLGIDRADEATTLGLDLGIIQRSGAWYSLPGGDRHNGRDKVVEALRVDPVMLEAVTKAIMATVSAEITDEVPPEQIRDVDDVKPTFRRGRIPEETFSS